MLAGLAYAMNETLKPEMPGLNFFTHATPIPNPSWECKQLKQSLFKQLVGLSAGFKGRA